MTPWQKQVQLFCKVDMNKEAFFCCQPVEDQDSRNDLLQAASSHDDILNPALNNTYLGTQQNLPYLSNRTAITLAGISLSNTTPSLHS